MPKKDSKSKKKKDARGGPQDAVEAVRAAVERTFHASAGGAQSTRERTRDLIDEVAAVASRVRQSLEDVRVFDEVKGLRGEVEALARRVSELERLGGSGASPSRAGVRATATRRSSTTSRKTSASSSRSGSGRSTRSSAAKSSSTAGRASGTRSRSTSSGSRATRSPRSTGSSPASGSSGSTGSSGPASPTGPSQ